MLVRHLIYICRRLGLELGLRLWLGLALGLGLAKISAVPRKLVQPKRTISRNALRGIMSISTSG